MFSTLALGMMTVALAHEGGDEMGFTETLSELDIQGLPALAHEAGSAPSLDELRAFQMQGAGSAPSLDESERRRITQAQILDLLDLRMCGNYNWVHMSQVLSYAVQQLRQQNIATSWWMSCDSLKNIILPYIRWCSLESAAQDHTVYAGLTMDFAAGASFAAVIGAYVDNSGSEGCFTTYCWGLGANLGAGGAAVAGLLMGDGTNDFPGVGYGAEFGGDWGPGYDFAGGFTTSWKPYAEISGGIGAGITAGVNTCTTWTW